MQEVVVTVRSTGEMEFLDGTPFAESMKSQGDSTKRRASNIEPLNFLLRVVFHLLRFVFGETGRVSNFTRNWKCVWRVNMTLSSGSIFGQYQNRQQALDAEINWLNINYFSKK